MSSEASTRIIDEAAQWLVKLAEGELSEPERAALAAWRGRSAEHERAWQVAMHFRTLVGAVPTGVGNKVWGRRRVDRRTLVKTLTAFAVLLPAGALTWQQLPALRGDYRTATGEQRTLILPDNTTLVLNTNTLIRTRFTEQRRVVELLQGEILVTTDPASRGKDHRPFVVETWAGQVRALGTRFSVRDLDRTAVHVEVFEHAVAICDAAGSERTRLPAGQAIAFSREQLGQPITLHATVPAWSRGQIVADNQRLADLLAEIDRYRPGLLRCDSAVADLRISGVYQLRDTDRILEILTVTLPVRIERVTRYWVTVTRT